MSHAVEEAAWKLQASAGALSPLPALKPALQAAGRKISAWQRWLKHSAHCLPVMQASTSSAWMARCTTRSWTGSSTWALSPLASRWVSCCSSTASYEVQVCSAASVMRPGHAKLTVCHDESPGLSHTPVQGLEGYDRYFAMARGVEDIGAMDMSKYFGALHASPSFACPCSPADFILLLSQQYCSLSPAAWTLTVSCCADTNYHYIMPELTADSAPKPDFSAFLDKVPH